MSKRKLNVKKSVLTATVVALMGAAVVGGAAYSKYISNINGNGRLPVAKWSFLVNGKDAVKGESLGTINLGEKTYTAQTIAEGKIAPGTQGSFDVVIDATGTEVGLDYKVVAKNVQNMPANMYFVVDGTEYKSLDEVAAAISGHFDANAASKEVTKTINWKWDYETTTSKDGARTTLADNDTQDTKDGQAAKDFTFTLDITATQAKPVESK